MGGPFRRIAIAAAAALAALPATPAAGQTRGVAALPAIGHIRSVLAQGEGSTGNAADLAANQATGALPPHFTDQQPLYVGIMPHAATLTAPDLDTYYKDTDFGAMPKGVERTETPKAGVRIVRDGFGMAHVSGDNRPDLMWGAGYATAEERLFLMDAVRHTAEGTLSELTGPGDASGDADQLTDQDFTSAELTKQYDGLPKVLGAAGHRAQEDILNYVAGINARIDEDMTNPLEMPAEYAALGVTPKPWTVADTAAMAVLLVTQFTVSNGHEEVNDQLQQAFRKRLGRRWFGPYHDLREAQDPEAFTVAKTPHRSDDTGRGRGGLNVHLDYGSIVKRNPEIEGPDAGQQAALRATQPAWIRSLDGLRASLPHWESNAVLVAPSLSRDGHALAAMGPQVGYYSPQIFGEYELHGGGIDAEGVTFPGASPWPLIGHGIDFVWSGTSANGDNEDTFVERLCNPDGSKPTKASTHYRYRGGCVAFASHDISFTTSTGVGNPSPPTKITFRTLRSVHGPIFAYATVHGAPVALAKAKAVDFHELEAAVPFMHLAENAPHNARQFMRVMGAFPGSENWFYANNRQIAFIQSGRYPRHARGSDVDLPWWGDGRADWLGFKPATYTARYIPASHRPQALDPRQHVLVSWNNKEAPGWRKGPTEWSNGPVHHAMILQENLFKQMRAHGGKVDLTGLARAVNLAATIDLRGEDVYPWMRRIVGRAGGSDGRLLALLDAWVKAGAHRLDADGDNVYEHSAAVALMDAWWTRFVRAEFRPTLGTGLFDTVESQVLSLGGVNDDFGWSWSSQVQKDLRDVLGAPERGRYSRVYCGGPGPRGSAGVRRRCRGLLLATLRQAAADVAKRYGSTDPAAWQVKATCDTAHPPACDQEVPTTAGALSTPAFPWQNRGTYHQVAEVTRLR